MSRSTAHRIEACLLRYLGSTSAKERKLSTETDLLKGLELCSDQGVELVLDLCDEFKFEFPNDFNPLVHPSRTRGMKLHELISTVDAMLKSTEQPR